MKKMICAFATCLLVSTATYADDVQIGIKDHTFMPSTITVPVGTKVTWTNHDDDPHTVSDVTKPPQFHSSGLDTDENYSYTFTTPGTYHYLCTLHPVMRGTIVVTDAK